jgi:SulP family sulfate permease
MSVQDLDALEEKKKIFDFSNLAGDFYGGLTAGIVALPLGLAFGAGVFPGDEQLGATAGLWGAILVGFFAAAFGGTNTQISGPTGPMVVVFAGLLASLTAAVGAANPNLTDPADLLVAVIPLLFASVILGGVLQIAMGVFKLGKYIKLVPYTVISGFMSGIGVIIILLQTSRLFGGKPASGEVFDAIAAIGPSIASTNVTALILGALTLAIVFFWPKAIAKYLPGTLASLIIGTVVGLFIIDVPTTADGALDYANASAPLLGTIQAGIPDFLIPTFSGDTIMLVIQAGIVLAILGAIDSLLTSLVADNVTRTRHNSDQELIGQGIANTIAGFFMALPGAGATMRTMVNVRTGGTTKISGMIHGLVLAAIVLVAAPLAAKIPMAVLAGILVKVGFDIIDFKYIKTLLTGPRWDFTVMANVLLLTVFWNLIFAVGIGVFMAALGYVKHIADTQTEGIANAAPADATDAEQSIIDASNNKLMLYDFGGPLSFGAASDLGHYMRLRAKQGVEALVLDFSRMTGIDVSAIRAVETIALDAEASGIPLFTVGIRDNVRKMLGALDADGHLSDERSFDNRLDALQAAAAAVKAG